MVWVPGVKPDSLGSSSVDRIPSRDEFHSHPVMVPSSSEPEPSKVTTSFLNLADEGVIESMVATGSRLGVAVSRAGIPPGPFPVLILYPEGDSVFSATEARNAEFRFVAQKPVQR